ncbi:uncharacterized protein LOC118433621 [Folsomia candida]|uniref:uncharacterized protein LOC118433621 n=1 Tax=Folsomia candida TaxID=158441 RepID=UPI001604D3E2|nr:uncharacterized protein LOC118433621 [Folsomia candida]
MTSFKEEVTLLEKCIATCLPGKEADVRVKLCRKTVEIGCHSDILRKSDVLSNWLGKRKEATNVSMDVGHLDTATFLRVLFFLYTGKVRAGLGAVEKMYHDLVCMYLKIPLDAEGFLAVVEWEEDRWCDLALEVTPEREGMVPVISQLMCTFKHAHCLPRNKGTVSLPTLKNGKPGMVLTQSAFKDHIIQTVHPIRGVSFNRLNHFCVNHNGLTLVGYEMHTIVIQLPPLERGVASNICGFIQAIWPGVHLIICNPRGLTVDDVSLHKNTARLTLTTGEVTVKSGQIKFYVTEGTLTICGRGVELRNLDRLSIFCHKLVVASTLSTKNLNIVTGPNIVEVDSFDEGAHDDNMAQITEIPTASPTLSFEVWKTAAISVFHGTIGVTGEGANNGRISSNTLDLDVSGILENSKTATICANLEAKLVAKHCENGGRIECDGKLRGIFDTYRTTQGSTVDCKDTKFVCRNYEVDGDFCGSLDIEAVLFENHSSMTCEGVKVRAEQVRNKGRIKSEDFDVVSTKMENEKDGLISSTNFNIRLNGEESKFENAGKIVSKVVTLNTEKFENITSGRMECGQIQLTTMHMGNNGSIKSEDFDLNSVTAVNGGDGLLISSKHLTVQLSGLESSFQNFGKVVAKKVSASTNKFVNSTNATFYSEGDCSVNFGDVGNATFENMGTVELHGICDLTTKEFSNKNKFYGNDVKIKGEKWHNGNRAIFHSSQFARAAVSSTFENFGKCTSANVFKVEANHVTNSGLIGGKEVDLAGSSGIKNGGVFQAEDEIKLASKVYEDTANSEISASRVSINCGETTVMGSVSGEIMRVAGETCKLERGSRIRVENGDYDVSKELVFNSPPEQNTLKIRGSGKIRNLAGISAQSGDIENTAEFRNIAPLLIEDLSLVTDVFENLGGAIVEGGKTSVSAKKFNNQGMINGTSTCTITSEVVSNAGKSIIHGGVLHIRSKVVENPRHGVIAARDGIKAEIDEFFNREDAVFYSGGFLDFGGYSNSHCQNFENISGIVDIKRDGNFSVRNFHQKNPAFRTELRFVSKFGMIDAQSGQRINISTSDKPYPELHKFSGGRRFFRFGRRVLVPESWVPFKDYTSYKFNRSISQTHIVETSPAKIYIGGRLTLSSETVLTNDKSHIFSQSMVGSLGELINLDEYGIKRIVDGGHSQSSWMETHRGGRKYRIAGPKKRKRVREYSSIAGYNPPAVDQPVQLQAYTCMLEDTPPEVGSQAGIQTLMGEYRTSNLVSYNVRRNAGIIRYQKISSEHYFDVGTLINHRFMFEIAGNNTFLRVDERLITPRQSEMEITISGMLGELGVSNPLRLPIILEQNIVRNQLIEMVGAILLTSFNDEDSQYVTLARNGFKFSAKFNILSGAELSSEHLERLEESIIWFVWRKIQTPNKDLKTALFPQVYLLERKSYQNPAGNSIISTNKMDLIIESVTNCGVLFANDMKLSAGSFLNDEGTVASGEKGMDILVQSQFTNLSGNLMGRGGKMRLETVDGDIVNETKVMPGGSNLGETATIYMQDGDLEMKSGRDFISKAAQFGNSGEGETRIGAKRDINLGAVGLHKSQRIVWDENSNMSEEYKDEVGSVLKMGGNLHLDAIDGDITTTGMRMEVGKKLGMDANNVNILSGEASSTFEIEHTSRHEFTFSSSTVHSKKTGSQKRAKPSQIAANDFVVTARDSLKTSGAVICVENELIGKAGNSISLLPAEESFKSYTYRDATTDDIFSESNTITDRGREGVRNRPTVLDSATGNVRMTAGGKFEQVGSLQQAAQGTVAAAGSTVNILPAVNSDRTTEHVSHTESGLFFGVSNPLLDGISNLEMLRWNSVAMEYLRINLTSTSLVTPT